MHIMQARSSPGYPLVEAAGADRSGHRHSSQGDMMYVANKAELGGSVEGMTEIFGYGAGSWAQGKDAEDASATNFLLRSLP